MAVYNDGVKAAGAVTAAEIPSTQATDAEVTTAVANHAALVGGHTGLFIEPQGRLTLTTGLPENTTNVAAGATVYYAPYKGNLVPIYNGTDYVPTVFTQLSNVLANSATGSAGPAAAIAASNYDLFVWSNAGTVTLTRGPLWTSDTGRGSGAGTSEIARVKGIYTNVVAITNGPGAGLGTYLGTIRTDAGGGTVSIGFGGSSAGGTAATIHTWNMYNRLPIAIGVNDASASWTYTSSTARAANGSNGNRISMIRGTNEQGVRAAYTQTITAPAVSGAYGIIGIGLDSTTAYAASGVSTLGEQGNNSGVALFGTPAARYSGLPGLGFHYLQALEQANNTNAATFGGGGLNLLEAEMQA